MIEVKTVVRPGGWCEVNMGSNKLDHPIETVLSNSLECAS